MRSTIIRTVIAVVYVIIVSLFNIRMDFTVKVIVSIGFTICILWDLKIHSEIVRNGSVCSAVVVRRERSGRLFGLTVAVRFEYDGSRKDLDLFAGPVWEYPIGSTVDVVYWPQMPNRVVLQVQHYEYTYWLSLVGIAAIVIFL